MNAINVRLIGMHNLAVPLTVIFLMFYFVSQTVVKLRESYDFRYLT